MEWITRLTTCPKKAAGQSHALEQQKDKNMGFFDFLKINCSIDPIWGKAELDPLGYSFEINFSSIKHPVQIAFLAGVTSPSAEDRNAVKTLEETYPALVPEISAALLKFWKEYKSEHERLGHYCMSLPQVSDAAEMGMLSALFKIEFEADSTRVKLFYEFGFHSEYVLMVTLEELTVIGVESKG